jgi:predicted DNA-binding protein (MmcQ/YjbR family)
MTQTEYNNFCQTLPHANHVVQWGGADVWKVDTKLFAVGGWYDGEEYAVTFKCSDIGYEVLRETPGCRPAPYHASRGMKWIQRTSAESLGDAELKDYIKNSHRLVSLNLTKKKQQQLGLNQENSHE